MTKLVSIIIPNWNGAPHLPTCFDAIARQTYPHLETILVDNASDDESISLIQNSYPWVRLLALPENQGFTGASNAGIRAAKGEIIALLNNDTEIDPNWVQALVEALEGHPEAGMAASKIYLFDRRTVFHSAGDAFGQNGIPINRGVWQEDQGQFDQDRYIFGGCGGAVAYRKVMLDDIGLLDDDFFFSCEDVDLNWRAQLAGYRCLFVPEAVVYHHLSATGGGEIASYYVGRNTIWMLVKSLPAVVWRKYFFKIILAQLKITWEALRAWRGKAAQARLRGQLAALVRIPYFLRKRRQIQAKQRVKDEYLESLLT